MDKLRIICDCCNEDTYGDYIILGERKNYETIDTIIMCFKCWDERFTKNN